MPGVKGKSGVGSGGADRGQGRPVSGKKEFKVRCFPSNIDAVREYAKELDRKSPHP